MRNVSAWFLFTAVALAGCSQPGKTPAKTDAKSGAEKTGATEVHAHEHHAHEHRAPHKGTLVVLGEEFAHVELVLDPATGKLTAYVLDGEAEKSVRVKQAEIEIAVTPAKAAATSVKLKAVASTLTGETAGDSSQFEGQNDALKGLKEFEGKLGAIEVKGQAFKDVGFNFPKGNEDHGGEKH